jgi:hypothetical protein
MPIRDIKEEEENKFYRARNKLYEVVTCRQFIVAQMGTKRLKFLLPFSKIHYE